MNTALTPLQCIDGTGGAENPYGVACRFWQLVFAGLTTMTFREKGADGIKRLWAGLLAGNQRDSFLSGLDKLGIDRKGPPAVVAGQYHYLTNVIGGLHMQYIEESPLKVWNRNMGPMWAYPGLAMLALPTELRRVIMASWHPHDGRMLGSRRLGWVITKTQMEGEPYDEGYFQEYPYDLADNELVRYELAARTPECDPMRQPTLDPKTWPPLRIFKARRSYTRGYVTSALQGLLALYGEQATAYMLRQAMQGVANQFVSEFTCALGIEGRSLQDCVALIRGILDSCGQETELEPLSAGKFTIQLKGAVLAMPQDATDLLRAAYLQFFASAVRALNGHVAITFSFESSWENGASITIEDCGAWLW